MRSRLVLPEPFLPCRYSSSPASSRKPRPANRRRSPRTHSRLSASSIRGQKTERNQRKIMNAQVYRQIDGNQTNTGHNGRPEPTLKCCPGNCSVNRAVRGAGDDPNPSVEFL